MPLDEQQAIGELIALHSRASSERAARLAHLQNVLEYTFPHMAQLTAPFTMGAKPYTAKYDLSGMLRAEECASSLSAQLTPETRRWFILAPPTGADRGGAHSLSRMTEELHNAMAGSNNFYTELHCAYQSLMSGTACVGVRRTPKEGSPFTISNRSANEYAFLLNDDGTTQQVFVEHSLTVYEAAKRWGETQLPREFQDALKKMSETVFCDRQGYLNVERPNETWDPESITSRGFPFEDLWIDLKNKKLLEKRGLDRLYYITPRWWKVAGLSLGFGPSDMAYAGIRALDKSCEIVLKYGATQMNPPSLWPDDGAWHPQDLTPGTYITGRMSAMDTGQPKWMALPGDHRIVQFLFEYYSGLIAQVYMVQLFQAIKDSKQRTAREVATILQKDWDMMIPVFGRLKAELFAPLLRVCLEVLVQARLGVSGWRYGGKRLGELAYDLDLISPLALAVKYAELQKMDDFLTLQGRLAEIRPEIWDKWSLDDMSEGIGDCLGIPERWKVSPYAANRIREKRLALMEQQQAMAQAQAASAAANKLAKGAEPNSPLAALQAA